MNTEISGKGIEVVDFYADWCGPCRVMASPFADAAKAFEGKASFVKVNTDEDEKSAARFQIESLPTFMVLKDGEVVDRITGSRSPSQFNAWLERNIKKAEKT